MSARLRVVACVLSGVLYFMSVAPHDLWPLAWVALVPLFCAVEGTEPRQALLLGWLMGAVTHNGGFAWMGGAMERNGWPAVAAYPAGVLAATYQGLLWGLFAGLWRYLNAASALTAGILAVTLEKLYWMPFPCPFAISQAWQPHIIQVAELGGPAAVTFLLVAANTAIYGLLRQGRRRQFAAVAAGIGLALAWGTLRIRQVESLRAAAPKLKVGVVQSNLPLPGPQEPASPVNLRRLQAASQALESRGAELVVWPETEYPYVFTEQQTRDWANPNIALLHGFHGPVLAGSVVLIMQTERLRLNSAVLLGPGGGILGRYDKRCLVPFGEYLPGWGATPWLGNRVPGRRLQVLTLGPHSLGVLICLEDILPDYCREVAQLDPECLFNLSNDAWFGTWGEPYQHLALAMFRPVEARLDLVRATRNGVSAFIDATGRIVSRTRTVDVDAGAHLAEPTLLLGEVALMHPAGAYLRLGALFSWLCVAASAAITARVAGSRRGHPRRSRGHRSPGA